MNGPIKAKNLTAQLQYRAEGNPPSTHPNSAISNAFPGLELDFRNVWRRIVEGIQLHEATNFVMAVDEKADPQLRVLETGWRLISIADSEVTGDVTGPLIAGGPNVILPDTTFGDTKMPLEWSNALAEVLHNHAGKKVRCRFQSVTDASKTLEFDLRVRHFFEHAVSQGETVKQAVISKELAPPGELTQSLCSPWQSDYRECACFYWAATRPDYVNVEAGPNGTSIGQNWMQKERDPNGPKVYFPDDWMDPGLVDYRDLYRGWEKSLRFLVEGMDEKPPEK
jgi:L-lysine epsilon oxidase-like protein